MTQATIWDSDWFKPHSDQDTELLRQLGFIPGLKELLILRQVHALEHATVWVLSEIASSKNLQDSDSYENPDNETLGGFSTDKGFYLYGQINQLDLQRAVRLALERLRNGEWNLAVHPRCGTNLSVTLLLTTGFILGAHLLLPRGPIEQLVGVGIAASTAAQLAPEIGISTQKYLTTAIPYNLEVVNISQKTDIWGRLAYFVQVRWRDLQ